MLELVFNDSAAGALKSAKISKSTVWTEKFLSGSGKNIASLMLELDIGSLEGISSDISVRKNVLDELYGIFPGVVEGIWKNNMVAIKRLEKAKATKEPIRMWISDNNPSEMCGFLFVCCYFRKEETPLSVVFIPSHVQKGNTITYYRNTAEVPAEKFKSMLGHEKAISIAEKRAYSNTWSELVSEKASLRAIVNGKIISVRKDFYDFVIRKNIPSEEFFVAIVIGKALMEMPGVSDRWLFFRLQKMVESGELIEVSKTDLDKGPYFGRLKPNLNYCGLECV